MANLRAHAPGDVLAGKYRLEGLLGEGGMGKVFAARRTALDDRVALKVLKPEAATDAEAVARFLREGRAAARVRGEHVARVLDVGELEDGTPYLAMELLEGDDLGRIVERDGPLALEVAVDYVLQACEALAEAHMQGIVHRDVKPSNLFLTYRLDGSASIKVLDFGISKLTSALDASRPDFGMTQTQTVMGSPQYMAPEQMRSSRRVDARTDIWAIGTVLHELLTGRAPFEASTMPELFAMILQDEPPSLAASRRDIPPAFEALVTECLAKDPDLRPASVADVAERLAPFGPASSRTIAESIRRLVAAGLPSSGGRLSLHAKTTGPRHVGSLPPVRSSSPSPAPLESSPELVGALTIRETSEAETSAKGAPRSLAMVVGLAGLAALGVVGAVLIFIATTRARRPESPPVAAADARTETSAPTSASAAPAGSVATTPVDLAATSSARREIPPVPTNRLAPRPPGSTRPSATKDPAPPPTVAPAPTIVPATTASSRYD